MEIILCVILFGMAISFFMAGMISLSNEDDMTKAKVKAMSRTANMPSYVGDTVYPNNYSTKHAPLVEFDINGYFNNKESN